jgi:hypothetical protein
VRAQPGLGEERVDHHLEVRGGVSRGMRAFGARRGQSSPHRSTPDLPGRAASTCWPWAAAFEADLIRAGTREGCGSPGPRGACAASGKDGELDHLHWQTGTGHLLSRLVARRTFGPVFLTDRRPSARRAPAAVDLCPHTGGRKQYPVGAGTIAGY